MGASPSKSEGGERRTLGSSLIDNAGYLCGSTKDTLDDDDQEREPQKKSTVSTLLQKADEMCISSPKNEDDDRDKEAPPLNPTSALLARALVNEVTDNPQTMTPAAMAEREKRLLKAQEAALKQSGENGAKPVGTMGQPNLLGSLAQAIKGEDATSTTSPTTQSASVVPPNSLLENRAQVNTPERNSKASASTHSVTIGLSLSRRHSSLGHPDTVTRQTAFDFNELQDRQYKYVSSTDASGWMAGGGEPGAASTTAAAETSESFMRSPQNNVTSMLTPQGQHKLAAPDTVHIPIIQIDAESPAAVNAIVTALARGQLFIPHMSVLPEALSVNGISPPDLVVRFGCERNDDVPPEEWPNWCLEFMHNQLYEYFKDVGAQWSPRPFQITLAKKVRWKTVKHMNRYFSHAERVIDAWREKGPQYLDPQVSYIEGGATPEEVARPHGIYLLRNGIPTNYFAPNFDPPYTTKMTRSLLLNVLDKSWDKKRREWTSTPVPRLVTPTMLVASMCGCTDPNQGGFMAHEATMSSQSVGTPKRVTAIPSMQESAKNVPEEEEEEEETNQDDEYGLIVNDVSMSNKSGESTKVSSVLLTPYSDDEDANSPPSTKQDSVAQLETTVEDDDDEEDDDDDESFLASFDTPSPAKNPAAAPTKADDSSPRPSVRGSSPTPETALRNKSVERAPTPERARMRSSSPVAGQQPKVLLSPAETAAPSEATTVEHMNSTSEKLMQREVERKKLREMKEKGLQAEGIEEVPPSLENVTPKVRQSNGSSRILFPPYHHVTHFKLIFVRSRSPLRPLLPRRKKRTRTR